MQGRAVKSRKTTTRCLTQTMDYGFVTQRTMSTLLQTSCLLFKIFLPTPRDKCTPKGRANEGSKHGRACIFTCFVYSYCYVPFSSLTLPRGFVMAYDWKLVNKNSRTTLANDSLNRLEDGRKVRWYRIGGNFIERHFWLDEGGEGHE